VILVDGGNNRWCVRSVRFAADATGRNFGIFERVMQLKLDWECALGNQQSLCTVEGVLLYIYIYMLCLYVYI
jgi:hypothetical protein